VSMNKEQNTAALEAERVAFDEWFSREVWKDGCYGNPDILKRQLWPCWQARAQLAAPAGVPAGWRLVPVEPTTHMLAGGFYLASEGGVTTTEWLRKTIWQGMLAAAPSPAPASADHSEDSRHMVSGVPVYQLQCREIGEGDWCPADLRHYTYCQKSPEMDTRIVEVAPASDVVQVPRELSDAARDVLAERHRQVCAEGWTPEHDDSHEEGHMATAGGLYAQYAFCSRELMVLEPPMPWPWHDSWWKPTDPRRNLIKAGALILAEIERIDRALLNGGRV
jgi:hypothetical protein